MTNLTSVGITAGVPTSGTGTVSTIDAMFSSAAGGVWLSSGSYIATVPNLTPAIGTKFSTIIASAGNNATTVKGSAAVLYGIHLYNNASSALFVKLYNLSSVPTVGTSTVLATVGVAPGANADVAFAGFGSTTGLGYTITAGVTSTSTVAVSADDIQGVIEYL